jgi:hypothetical protein
MNLRSINIIIVLTCIIIFMFVLTAEGAELKVKVKVEKAQIRLKPSSESTVVEEAPLGAVLETKGKDGEWFIIALPSEELGFIISGYIHESQVEIIEEHKMIPKEEPAKKEPVPVSKPEPKIRSEFLEKEKPYTRNNHFKIFADYFVPSEQSFKDIYGGGMAFGAEVNIKVWKFVDLWLVGNYYSKGGRLPYTEENTDMTLIPIGSGLKLRFQRGALNPYIGFGPMVYLYEEKNAIGEAKGTSFGFIGQAGCYFRVIGRFLIDVSVNYSYCKAKPQRIQAQLGGIQAGIGLGIEF